MAQIDWGYIVPAAIVVVGVLQWGKGMVKTAPGWLWALLAPVACAVVAIAGGGSVNQIATNGLATLAISQLGYEALLQGAQKIIAKFTADKAA